MRPGSLHEGWSQLILSDEPTIWILDALDEFLCQGSKGRSVRWTDSLIGSIVSLSVGQGSKDKSVGLTDSGPRLPRSRWSSSWLLPTSIAEPCWPLPPFVGTTRSLFPSFAGAPHNSLTPHYSSAHPMRWGWHGGALLGNGETLVVQDRRRWYSAEREDVNSLMPPRNIQTPIIMH
jgi:hypothetical protein